MELSHDLAHALAFASHLKCGFDFRIEVHQTSIDTQWQSGNDAIETEKGKQSEEVRRDAQTAVEKIESENSCHESENSQDRNNASSNYEYGKHHIRNHCGLFGRNLVLLLLLHCHEVGEKESHANKVKTEQELEGSLNTHENGNDADLAYPDSRSSLIIYRRGTS